MVKKYENMLTAVKAAPLGSVIVAACGYFYIAQTKEDLEAIAWEEYKKYGGKSRLSLISCFLFKK